jgi:hypothetical protein
MATQSIVQCSNLRKVTLIVHDHPICSLLAGFLSTLWATVGGSLEKLCIQATHMRIPLLLAPITDMRAKLSNLSSFDLTITHSRSMLAVEEAKRSTTTIIHFLKSFKTSLSSFSLTPLVVYNMCPLFDSLELMPKLKKLELIFVMCDLTFPNRSSLVSFLARHSATLEELVLDQRPPHSTFFPSYSHLGEFLTKEFAQVKMANLHTLQVGSEKLPLKLVPEVLPKLRHLAVHTRTTAGVCHSRLREILESTKGGLESLDIRLYDFTIEALDLFGSLCPQLRRLTVRYTVRTSLDLGTPGLLGPRETWFKPYSSRRYPNWPLEYLRLGTTGQWGSQECGELHPDTEMMNSVSKTVFPRTVEKDAQRTCLHDIYPSTA